MSINKLIILITILTQAGLITPAWHHSSRTAHAVRTTHSSRTSHFCRTTRSSTLLLPAGILTQAWLLTPTGLLTEARLLTLAVLYSLQQDCMLQLKSLTSIIPGRPFSIVQLVPLPSGEGLVHVLIFWSVPPPQVFVHFDDNLDHLVQSPFTSGKRKGRENSSRWTVWNGKNERQQVFFLQAFGMSIYSYL